VDAVVGRVVTCEEWSKSDNSEWTTGPYWTIGHLILNYERTKHYALGLRTISELCYLKDFIDDSPSFPPLGNPISPRK